LLILTPLHFPNQAALSGRLALFEGYYNAGATPFRWRFDRKQLEAYVQKLAAHDPTFATGTASPPMSH